MCVILLLYGCMDVGVAPLMESTAGHDASGDCCCTLEEEELLVSARAQLLLPAWPALLARAAARSPLSQHGLS